MSALLDALPYARFLGLMSEERDGEMVVTMPFAERLIGNPFLPALHGGSTAALLEFTAMAEVARVWPRLKLPRPINVTVAYLRTGRPEDVHARARISKAGRSIAYVSVEAWQDARATPIAAMTAHFVISTSA